MVKQKIWLSPNGDLLIIDIFGVESNFGHFLFGFANDDNREGAIKILKSRKYVCLGYL